MNVEDIELHDALLKGMSIDYAKKSITISLDIYEGKDKRSRIAASIIFSEVDSLSHIVDVKELKEHTFAGHISYWRLAENNETTYIYLATGCIIITAKKVAVQFEK